MFGCLKNDYLLRAAATKGASASVAWLVLSGVALIIGEGVV